MPTIIRYELFQVKVFGPPREHPPPHVHVFKARESAVIIRLGVNGAPPSVWAVYDMSDRDVVVAFHLVEQHNTELLQAWHRIHA